MLSSADRALIARDPHVPGLPLLLDDEALGDWLGAPVRRRYVRYKPGTGCVLGLDVAGRRAFVVAYAHGGAGKLGKAVDRSPSTALLAVDPARLLLAGLPAADRDLPALGRLLAEPSSDLGASSSRDRLLGRVLPGRDLAGADLRLLSHKPQRRWVGLLTPSSGEPVVLRVHRPTDSDALLRSAMLLSAGQPGTPQLLGSHVRAGVIAMTWLTGEELHGLLAVERATAEQLRAAGAALAVLHARPPGLLVHRTAADDHSAVTRAAAAVGALVPDLAGRAEALAGRLIGQFSDEPRPLVTVHGDFSADQVVLRDDGSAGLVDLDAVAAGEAALDLGSAIAALSCSALLGNGPRDVAGTVHLLLDGYAEVAPLLAPDRLDLHTCAALLRRAAEPFRLCVADWALQVERTLNLAEELYQARAQPGQVQR